LAGETTEAQRAWVERVLGFDFGSAARSEPRVGVANTAFMKARLEWDATRKRVQGELQKLEQAVLAECAEELDFDVIKSNSKLLYTVLDHLDTQLIDKLDEALNADGEARLQAAKQARGIIGSYLDYVARDELLRDVDDNGFVDIAIAASVTQTLQTIDGQLAAV
jgi:hypothetical protein